MDTIFLVATLAFCFAAVAMVAWALIDSLREIVDPDWPSHKGDSDEAP